MKKKRFFLLALALLALSAPLQAGTSMDIGEGAELCEKYAKKSLEKKNIYIVWVQGFFSAFNALDPKTKNIAGTKDYHYVRKWLDDYCKANPTMYFGEAVRMLIEELYPNRIPNTPAQEPKPGEGVSIQFK
ncbi:MAG TPA: hypothetical protein VJR29_08080 [bacterium]|nr:hypothetical protein [bacterium]